MDWIAGEEMPPTEAKQFCPGGEESTSSDRDQSFARWLPASIPVPGVSAAGQDDWRGGREAEGRL